MPMDLESLRVFVEEEMTDTCKITLDAENSADDTYVEATATYTVDTGITTLYSGKCFMSTQGWQPRDEVQGGQEIVSSAFKLVLPVAAKAIPKDAKVEMKSSMRNPHLKGQFFVVDDRIDSSHSVSQNLLVHRITRKVPL